MDDLDLDRELQSALDVAPSPEFVARVRGAVAERPPRRSSTGWLTLVAGTACLGIALTIVEMSRPETPDNARTRMSPVPPRSAALAPAGRAESAGTSNLPPVDPAPRRSRSRGMARSGAPAMPEVLVSEADKRAFEEFIAAVHQHRFAATFEETPASTPYVVTELAVSPIVIAPLADSASTDGPATLRN